MTQMPDSPESEFWKENDNAGDTRWEDKSNIQGGETDAYPTDWRIIDHESGIECRQLSLDTYELKSPTHKIMVNREGFELFRDGSSQGAVIWNDWLRRNNIVSTPLEATDGN